MEMLNMRVVFSRTTMIEYRHKFVAEPHGADEHAALSEAVRSLDAVAETAATPLAFAAEGPRGASQRASCRGRECKIRVGHECDSPKCESQ
jgi:hypothetical protein